MKPLTDDMINYILYGTEERQWEFKPPMAWSNKKKKKKFEIAKTAFALSNTTNGGFIVIGISQKRDRTNGVIFERRGLTTRQFNTFDSADDIGRFFNEKTNQELKFDLYGGNVPIDSRDRKFVVIQIYESRASTPVVCTFNFKSRDRRSRLEKGDLFIRSISNPIESRTIRTTEEWEELVRRLLSRKEEILYEDLKVLCSNVKFDGKKDGAKKPKKPKPSRKYDNFLKRDKL